MKEICEFREMIDAKEINEMIMKKEIYQLKFILFCKKYKNISKNNFIYSIYRFLIINSIKKNDNFMIKLNITNIITKLQWIYHVIIYKKILWKMKKILKK